MESLVFEIQWSYFIKTKERFVLDWVQLMVQTLLLHVYTYICALNQELFWPIQELWSEKKMLVHGFYNIYHWALEIQSLICRWYIPVPLGSAAVAVTFCVIYYYHWTRSKVCDYDRKYTVRSFKQYKSCNI